MSLKFFNFKVERPSDLDGGHFRRKRYNQIITELVSRRFLALQYPANISIGEDLFGVAEIIVEYGNKKFFCDHPVCINNTYRFHEISNYTIVNDYPEATLQIYDNGFHFSDDSLVSPGLPEHRSIETIYEFHQISVTLTHPVNSMSDFIRRIHNVISELQKFFNGHIEFRFHDVLNVVLNELNIEKNELKTLHIPQILYVSNGIVELATTQYSSNGSVKPLTKPKVSSITTLSKKYTVCDIGKARLEVDENQVQNLIIKEECNAEEAKKICHNLINEVHYSMSMINGNH